MKAFFYDLNFFLKNKFYILSVLLIAIMSYGYAAVNTTVSIDDFRAEQYIGFGGEFWQSGRLALILWPNLLGYKQKWVQNSFAIDVLGVFFLILAAISFCILFRRCSEDNMNMASYICFSCIFISYPLINEIWEYTSTNSFICLDYFFVAIVLLILKKQICNGFYIGESILCICMLMLACSSYESFAVVYVFSVFSVMVLQIIFGNAYGVKDIIKHGCIYAFFLAGGLAARLLLHKILLFICGIEQGVNGATGILWGQESFKQILYDLVMGLLDRYVLWGIVYFPITELILSVVLGIVLMFFFFVKKRKVEIFIPSVGMLLSLILLSLIQGCVTPYRACQVFSIYIAFILMLFVYVVSSRWMRCPWGVIVLIMLLSVNQAIYLNYFLTLNHLRSEEEGRVICNIGQELLENFDMKKPVVFTGTYCPSNGILESASIDKQDIRWKVYAYMYSKVHNTDFDFIYDNASRKLPHTNVNSVITWAMGDQRDLQLLFEYYGISIKVVGDETIRDEAERCVISEEVSAYPQKGYIVEKGDYIIVNIE